MAVPIFSEFFSDFWPRLQRIERSHRIKIDIDQPPLPPGDRRIRDEGRDEQFGVFAHHPRMISTWTAFHKRIFAPDKALTAALKAVVLHRDIDKRNRVLLPRIVDLLKDSAAEDTLYRCLPAYLALHDRLPDPDGWACTPDGWAWAAAEATLEALDFRPEWIDVMSRPRRKKTSERKSKDSAKKKHKESLHVAIGKNETFDEAAATMDRRGEKPKWQGCPPTYAKAFAHPKFNHLVYDEFFNHTRRCKSCKAHIRRTRRKPRLIESVSRPVSHSSP